VQRITDDGFGCHGEMGEGGWQKLVFHGISPAKGLGFDKFIIGRFNKK
jgi:hypothetical protein